ncbi:hypothetical protein ACWGH5_39890 [Streptomyces sp. NPDC054864]
MEARSRRARFVLSDELWDRLSELGGNVAALHRWMMDGGVVVQVPSLGTLHRSVRRDVRGGRVLEVARSARGRVEAGGYDRVLAELKLEREGEGLPVVDADQAVYNFAGDPDGRQSKTASI